MLISNTIDTYFKLQKEIHDYFGYEENYRVIPLEDFRDNYWVLDVENDKSKGYIWYSNKLLTSELVNKGEELYSSAIYTQRFLSKFVYRTDLMTLVSMDTRTDCNCFIGIFDNSKEIQDIDKSLFEQWKPENWGNK